MIQTKDEKEATVILPTLSYYDYAANGSRFHWCLTDLREIIFNPERVPFLWLYWRGVSNLRHRCTNLNNVDAINFERILYNPIIASCIEVPTW